jgi:hypothetical protein
MAEDECEVFATKTLFKTAFNGKQALTGYAQLPEMDMERYFSESKQAMVGGGTHEMPHSIIARKWRCSPCLSGRTSLNFDATKYVAQHDLVAWASATFESRLADSSAPEASRTCTFGIQLAVDVRLVSGPFRPPTPAFYPAAPFRSKHETSRRTGRKCIPFVHASLG